MSFETIETITRHNMPPVAKISYMPSMYRRKDGSPAKAKPDAKPQLTIWIPTTVCGVSKAKSFVLQIGSGANKGKLRIKGIKDKAKGAIEPHQLMHAFVFRFGFVPKLGEDHFDGEHHPVRKIGDDEFEIDVPPSWFA